VNDGAVVFLNNEYLPLRDAKISVLDRGFLFGDGVYEVIPVYGGRIFRLYRHMERLDNSLSATGIVNPYGRAEWEAICTKLLERNPGDGDKFLYLQVTRGQGDREHLYSDDMVPTVFVMCRSAVGIIATSRRLPCCPALC